MAKATTVLVGIAGGSGSGKSSLAEAITSASGQENVLHVCMDSYYKDISRLSDEEKRIYNFDCPDALDVASIVDHLTQLKDGKTAPHFDFDYATKSRILRGDNLRPKPVIIVEGILTLAIPSVRELLDYKLFVDTPGDLRLIRRARRDMTTYQRTFFEIADQYEATVREMHDLFVEPSKDYSDVIIPYSHGGEAAVDLLVRGVSTFVARRPARRIESPVDESEMLLVPEGDFLMGTSDIQQDLLIRDYGAEVRWFNDERPQRKIYVSSFYIDKFPITNAQYRDFVDDTGHRAPETWRERRFRADQLPVTGVSFEDAEAYAKWAGKRLPTEAEWEKAARGINGRIFPWGNEGPEGRANFGNKLGGPSQGGRFPEGASPYGVMDMAGNVWEWVQDHYDDAAYSKMAARDPHGPKSGRGRVVRGGSWVCNPTLIRCAERDVQREPLSDLQFFGFRCVIPLEHVR